MVQRDEDSINGKRINGTGRKQRSPPTFVNQFARYVEQSKASYVETLRLGRTNHEILRPNPAQPCPAANAQLDGNLSRSYSTPSFDSPLPSKPSLPHSISFPDLESQGSQTDRKNTSSSSGHDLPNSSSSGTKRSLSAPSTLSKSSNPLYFGKLKSHLSLPKSFPYQYASASTDLETTSNGKSSTPPPPSRLSDSDSLKKELQRLIKRAMESGSLQRQCADCGDSQHCCGQTMLEAVFSIPPT